MFFMEPPRDIYGAMAVLSSCGGGQSGMKWVMTNLPSWLYSLQPASSLLLIPLTIKGVQDIEVRPQVSGFIVKLCVDEGATVKKGQASFRSILHSMRLRNVRQKLL